jgi:hypothetical protein
MLTPIGWGRSARASAGQTLADQAAATTRSVRLIRLGFLGDWPFRYGNNLFGVLDFLGFPWILSSESSLFNGLYGIFAGTFFLAVFPR